jgi:hypothetical protein
MRITLNEEEAGNLFVKVVREVCNIQIPLNQIKQVKLSYVSLSNCSINIDLINGGTLSHKWDDAEEKILKWVNNHSAGKAKVSVYSDTSSERFDGVVFASSKPEEMAPIYKALMEAILPEANLG